MHNQLVTLQREETLEIASYDLFNIVDENILNR